MRLLKLMAYCLLGYVVYEFWRGLQTPLPRAEATGRGNRSGPGAAESTGSLGRVQVWTEDASGTSVQHTVGRGVRH